MMLAVLAQAQVASWVIPPHYDKINKVVGADLVVTDSVGETSLWTFEGQRIFKTSDTLFPFQENIALITKRSTTELVGFVSTRGEFISLEGFLVVHQYPYFSERLLAVKNVSDNSCYYIDKMGRKAIRNCFDAYPFCNGFAKCQAYQNSQKKSYSNLLLDRNGQPVKFNYNGRRINNEDVAFISSVNDENIAVLVANKMVYLFDSQTQQLQAICAEGETAQAQVEGEVSDFLSNTFGGESELTAQSNGKSVVVHFNNLCQPTEMAVDSAVKTYTQRQRPEWRPTTALEVNEYDNTFGIDLDGKEVLPPQFAYVPNCFDNNAFVYVQGKGGMLRVNGEEAFEFSMNRGNDIAFRHQRVETTLHVNLPPSVSASTAKVEMLKGSGVELDASSREVKETDFGSSLLYGCALTIPKNLSDETQEVEYRARVFYDGLASTLVPFKVSEWYYKYFNVNVEDVETVINNGNLDFTFNITADKLPGEEDYPCTVNVKASNLPVQLEKLSETRYKCHVTGLRNGVNLVHILIQEPGCPVSEYPFEVSYTKPAPQSTNKPAVKENVVIKNNSKPKRPAPPQPAKPQQPKKPRLEI